MSVGSALGRALIRPDLLTHRRLSALLGSGLVRAREPHITRPCAVRCDRNDDVARSQVPRVHEDGDLWCDVWGHPRAESRALTTVGGLAAG
jgi:hypothetical protein